jgi:hypothetical protein
MNSGQVHYCEVGGKGKVLSANHWVWVGCGAVGRQSLLLAPATWSEAGGVSIAKRRASLGFFLNLDRFSSGLRNQAALPL